jgi:hypothetical protein
MLVSLKRYVFDLENLVELVMIGLVAIILFLPEEEQQKEEWCQLKRHLAAIALGKILLNHINVNRVSSADFVCDYGRL